MGSPGRFVVYVDGGDRLAANYVLHLVCHAWREFGGEVVVLGDPGRVVAADLAMVHVSATRRSTRRCLRAIRCC